jgi:class 3 adenylate cyclase
VTFEEVLDQAIAMLQRRGRLTYRTLKRQFHLDDEALEDLKAELLFSHPVADEAGQGLVWAGEVAPTLEPLSIATPATQQEVPQEAQPTQVEPPPPEPYIPDAEHRQLTVMFCDLADSTKLSGQLDPEDLRDVIRAYQSASAEVIERYDGYIAQHLGDGLMVYFGWLRPC